MTRTPHKSVPPTSPAKEKPTDAKLKEAYQVLHIKAMQRAEAAKEPIELKFDTTPEGLVAFSKYLVEQVGLNKLDIGRASVINGILQTVLRTNESGIDAIKNIEEDALHLAEKVRVRTPNTTKP